MNNQDTIIDTSSSLDDGGNVLDQNDLGSYIRVLIASRNDAYDQIAVYRTKNISFTAQIKQSAKALQEVSRIIEEKDAEITTLKAQLASYETSKDSTNTIEH